MTNRNPNPARYACWRCGSTRLFRSGTFEVSCRECHKSFEGWPLAGSLPDLSEAMQEVTR